MHFLQLALLTAYLNLILEDLRTKAVPAFPQPTFTTHSEQPEVLRLEKYNDTGAVKPAV